MGEVAALRQLVGQVQELWDLYGANAHPLPRQQNLPPSRPLGYYYSAALPPLPLVLVRALRLPAPASLGSACGGVYPAGCRGNLLASRVISVCLLIYLSESDRHLGLLFWGNSAARADPWLVCSARVLSLASACCTRFTFPIPCLHEFAIPVLPTLVDLSVLPG